MITSYLKDFENNKNDLINTIETTAKISYDLLEQHKKYKKVVAFHNGKLVELNRVLRTIKSRCKNVDITDLNHAILHTVASLYYERKKKQFYKFVSNSQVKNILQDRFKSLDKLDKKTYRQECEQKTIQRMLKEFYILDKVNKCNKI